MALKIDLDKAYDKLEWSFIWDMLIRINLPKDLIEIIMSCVTSVSTSILFNGEALDPIFPSRGNKVGWPIVPIPLHYLYGLPWTAYRRKTQYEDVAASISLPKWFAFFSSPFCG